MGHAPGQRPEPAGPPAGGNGAHGRTYGRVCRAIDWLAPLVRHATRVALPRKCLLCGLSCGDLTQAPICSTCDAVYWNEPRLRCEVCALPLPALSARPGGPGRFLCSACLRTPAPFDATLALADYRPPLERLALGLKFHARLAVAREFGNRLARLADDHAARTSRPDVLAPMPLAHARLVARGFNQAWEIARPLARALGVAAEPTLMRRIADTAQQSRLDRDARRRNVAAAFRVTHAVRGLHVGLVDDVMTSGATLEAAARVLKAAGARRVTNFVALRTPKD
jgi:ComF family protein